MVLMSVAFTREEDLEATAADLPELPLRYADYARWQREWLDVYALCVTAFDFSSW